MKKMLIIILGLFVLALGVVGANYFYVGTYIAETIKSDLRNVGIDVAVHLENYISPSTLVFDIRSVSDTNSPLDVFRVFLGFSASVKDMNFKQVKLAYNGNVKFYIDGDYFKSIGQEFKEQNPVYTIRTFPENLYRPNGEKAFETWTGGVLGVLGQQMDDFNSFHQEWYIQDMSRNAD